MAGLTVFDPSVEPNIKRLIVAAVKQEHGENPHSRAQADLAANEAIAAKTVADFVN
jgi:hypothetical protein